MASLRGVRYTWLAVFVRGAGLELTCRSLSAQFGDNLYGTSKATIEEQSAKGKIVVLDIEMEGVKQIKATGFPARYVFIAPPSEEELEKRLRGRGTDKEESILKRLAQAKLELEFSKTPGVHDKIIVNNVSWFGPWCRGEHGTLGESADRYAGLGEGVPGAGRLRVCRRMMLVDTPLRRVQEVHSVVIQLVYPSCNTACCWRLREA